jgi:hypothetical protein
VTPDEVRAQNEQLKAAYHALFRSPGAQLVMADLAAYCNARRTTFRADAREHAFEEGKRDVFNRISEFCNLSVDEIYMLRGGYRRPIAQKEDTDG